MQTANAERFVLAVNVIQAESILRYREGDFNETVYVKDDEILRLKGSSGKYKI